MLNDSYVEQVLKAKPEKSYYMKMLLAAGIVVLGIGLFLFVGGIGIVTAMIGIYLMVYFAGFGKVEYEYTLTNGSVEIAAIYNASKRKEKMHFEMEQVTMIVPAQSQRISNEKFVRTHDYTSQSKDKKAVSMVVENDGKKELVTMELNDRSMGHIRNYAKNKIYDL